MDFNQKLTAAREQRAEASDEMMALVAEADGNFNDEQRARYDELESTVNDSDKQIDVLERTLKVGSHHEKINDKLDLSDKEKNSYSFMKVVRAMALRAEQPQLMEEIGFELECSRAIAKNIDREPFGFYIPREVWSNDAEKRTMVTATGDKGGFIVEEDLREDMFVGMLRNNSAVIGAGAMTLSGLRGDVAIPGQSGAAQYYWLGTEETDVTESDLTLRQITMSPKHGAAHTRYSRQALVQTSPAIESLIRNDFSRISALGIDTAALYGTGANGQPRGVINVTGVNKPTKFAAATPTWAELMTMVGEIASDNALSGFGGGEDGGGLGSVNWIVEGSMAANLMAAEKASSTAQFILQMEGGAPRVGLWSANISNQVTDGDVWFGDFSQLMVGTWGDVDLIVNPFTNDTSGVIRLTLHQFVDVAVRHAESFCYNNDT